MRINTKPNDKRKCNFSLPLLQCFSVMQTMYFLIVCVWWNIKLSQSVSLFDIYFEFLHFSFFEVEDIFFKEIEIYYFDIKYILDGNGWTTFISSMDPTRQQQVASGNYQNMQGSFSWWIKLLHYLSFCWRYMKFLC